MNIIPNKNKGKIVSLTTPGGTYKVRLPKNWTDATALSVGHRIKHNDYVLTALGSFIQMKNCWKNQVVNISGDRFPQGYYFRNSRHFVK